MSKSFLLNSNHKLFPKNRETLIEAQRQRMIRTPLMIFGLSVGFVILMIVILSVGNKLEGAGGLPLLIALTLAGGGAAAFFSYLSLRGLVGLYESGQILDGAVVSVKPTQNKAIYDIKYQFTSPTGKACKGSIQWQNKQQKLPAEGTPVNVLYKSDRYFTLL